MSNKLTVSEYIEKRKEISKEQGIIVKDITVETNLLQVQKDSRTIINKELIDYFSLLDLGITAIIEMHIVCKEKDFLYACISAKLVSQLLAMRELLYQGLMDCVKTINRAFHETMEIFFACLIDNQFASEYGQLLKLYDNNNFWKTKISGRKLDKYISKIFDDLGYPTESKKEYFKRRESSKLFLSESIHASLNSAFSAYIMPTLDGTYSTNIYGKITTAYPLAMYELLTDICLLNSMFFRSIYSEKISVFSPTDIEGIKWTDYHYYTMLYDDTYDIYYQALYKKGYNIVQTLNKNYELIKKTEEGMSEEQIRNMLNKLH